MNKENQKSEKKNLNQIQEFLASTEPFAEDFKTNLNTGLQESRKQEKEFLNEIVEDYK